MNALARVRRSLAHRVAAVCTVVALALASFATPLHLAIEAHHWCGEHQALEHDAQSDGAPSAPSSPTVPRHDSHHSTCSIVLVAPVDRDTAPPIAIASAPLPRVDAPRAPSRAIIPAIATLRIAPKTSPPHIS